MNALSGSTDHFRPTDHRRSRAALIVAVLASLAVATVPALAAINIDGTTVDMKGKAIKGAIVSIVDANGNTVTSEESDKKGKFRLRIEAAGAYTIMVEAKGFGPYHQDVKLESGMQTTAELKLVDEATWTKQEAVNSYNRAVEALQSGDEDAAVMGFETAVELDPTLLQSYGALSTIYHSKERWDDAVVALEMLPAVPPQLAPVAFDAYRKTGDDAKAAAFLAQVQDPAIRADLAVGVYNDGVALNEEGDADGARMHFVQASELDPSMVAAHRSLAALSFNEGAFEDALAPLDTLLGMEPTDAAGLRMRYLSLDRLERDDLKDAMAAYVASAGDEAAETIADEAFAMFEQGSTDQALRRLRPLAEVRPDMASVHYRLGLALAQSDPAGAKTHLQKFIDMDPTHSDAEAARAIIAEL